MPSIRAETVASLLRNVLDPENELTIEWEAKVGDYILGGAGALAAFADVLNRSPQFSGFGLALGPHDMAAVAIVRDLLIVLIGWFQGNGWTVTL
jgi:hypothetical protein